MTKVSLMKLRRQTDSISDNFLSGIIEKANKIIEENKENELTLDDFRVITDRDVYDDYDHAALEYWTFETNKEYKVRIEEEKARKLLQEEQSRKQYEFLKKKFESRK